VAVQLLERRAHYSASRERSGFVAAIRHLDLLLISAALCLSAIGVVMVYSTTDSPPDPTSYLKHQVIYVVLGVVAMVLCMIFDYHRLEEWAVVIYVGAFLALLAVRAVGRESTLGASREISLGLLTIQPSEFAVLAIVIAVAVFFHRHESELGPRMLTMLALIVVPEMLLVLLEPDLGTTVITGVAFVTMLVVGGVRLRYLVLLAVGLIGAAALGSEIHLLHAFQGARITAWLHQSECSQPKFAGTQQCWQFENAKTAIGAGGLGGTGLFQGALTNTNFIPENSSDFIFSAVGEQLGFVGSLIVVGLFSLIALRMIRAIQSARDTLGRLICAGALAFIAFSAFLNIGMNIGLMPVTGIPLPFVSYGGSALFATFASIGLVANVEMRRWRQR
jgi:rod shape determining protein RodA